MLRIELAEVTDPNAAPLQPAEFVERYVVDLQRRIENCEKALELAQNGRKS